MKFVVEYTDALPEHILESALHWSRKLRHALQKNMESYRELTDYSKYMCCCGLAMLSDVFASVPGEECWCCA